MLEYNIEDNNTAIIHTAKNNSIELLTDLTRVREKFTNAKVEVHPFRKLFVRNDSPYFEFEFQTIVQDDIVINIAKASVFDIIPIAYPNLKFSCRGVSTNKISKTTADQNVKMYTNFINNIDTVSKVAKHPCIFYIGKSYPITRMMKNINYFDDIIKSETNYTEYESLDFIKSAFQKIHHIISREPKFGDIGHRVFNWGGVNMAPFHFFHEANFFDIQMCGPRTLKIPISNLLDVDSLSADMKKKLAMVSSILSSDKLRTKFDRFLRKAIIEVL